MSLIIDEKHLEQIVAENYWMIFHEDEDRPKFINIQRQYKLNPYGTADIVVIWGDLDSVPKNGVEKPYTEFKEDDWDLVPFVHIDILEIKIGNLKERDLSQISRYFSSFKRIIRAVEEQQISSIDIPIPFITAKLIGLSDESEYESFVKGDEAFVHLYDQVNRDIDVYTFKFGIDGFKFKCLPRGWEANNGDEFDKTKSKVISDIADMASKMESKNVEAI
jgi:hypothetical protein